MAEGFDGFDTSSPSPRLGKIYSTHTLIRMSSALITDEERLRTRDSALHQTTHPHRNRHHVIPGGMPSAGEDTNMATINTLSRLLTSIPRSSVSHPCKPT